MLTSITNALAFFLAAIIPIPALRSLCIMVSLNYDTYCLELLNARGRKDVNIDMDGQRIGLK